MTVAPVPRLGQEGGCRDGQLAAEAVGTGVRRFDLLQGLGPDLGEPLHLLDGRQFGVGAGGEGDGSGRAPAAVRTSPGSRRRPGRSCPGRPPPGAAGRCSIPGAACQLPASAQACRRRSPAGWKRKPGRSSRSPVCVAEMMVGARVGLGLGVEAAVLQVQAHGEAHRPVVRAGPRRRAAGRRRWKRATTVLRSGSRSRVSSTWTRAPVARRAPRRSSGPEGPARNAPGCPGPGR